MSVCRVCPRAAMFRTRTRVAVVLLLPKAMKLQSISANNLPKFGMII